MFYFIKVFFFKKFSIIIPNEPKTGINNKTKYGKIPDLFLIRILIANTYTIINPLGVIN